MYYHVSTILMRVALGTISKFHIYFYFLYYIIFTLREMFKFVKVATLALAFVAGTTRQADAVSLAEVY